MRLSWFISITISAVIISGCNGEFPSMGNMDLFNLNKKDDASPKKTKPDQEDQPTADKKEQSPTDSNSTDSANSTDSTDSTNSTNSTDSKPKDTPKVSHQGKCLAIKIDNTRTRPFKIDNNTQIWTVPSCSQTPKFQFLINASKLGKLKPTRTRLSFFPLENNKKNPTHFYYYSKSKSLSTRTLFTLNNFDHTQDNVLKLGITSLPRGKYRVELFVAGKDNWDKQIIDLEVK